MKTNHIITYLVIAIILISCGKSSSEDNKKGNKDSLEISGTISMIANTVFPTAEAAEQEVSCSSICLNIDQTKCLKLNLIEGNGSLKLLCKTDIKDNGTYSFNIENKGSLKGKALKIEVDNFNGYPRSFFTDVGDIESTEKIKSDINEITTAISDVEKKYFIDNKNGVATPNLSKEEHGQLLKRDLIRMCPNVITENNVLDVIRRYMGVLASSDKSSLLIEFRKLSELGSVANIQSQIDSFCSLVQNPNQGSTYPLSTQWFPLSLNNGLAPADRFGHTAVWTGSKMCIWGGSINAGAAGGVPVFQDGGCFERSSNTWNSISNTGGGVIPEARDFHTAIWTGTEMCVWGGQNSVVFGLNTGGCYNPVTDSWRTISNTGGGTIPEGRYGHKAIWTGSKMCVWGGYYYNTILNTGGCYDPANDSWTTISNSGGGNIPVGRFEHSMIWTGTKMCVWGGYYPNLGWFVTNTGGCYNPQNDSWGEIPVTDAPLARGYHAGVWTGTKMCVWGGQTQETRFNDGGCYNPTLNTWSSISLVSAPEARSRHSVIWTGNKMCIWGGGKIENPFFLNTGGCYDPEFNTWTSTPLNNALSAREGHTAVWTGNSMIVFGGRAYNPNPDGLYVVTTHGELK